MPTAAPLAADALRALVERLERLNDEKQYIADDIKSVFAEAKGQGFDVKVLKRLIRLRRMDPDERLEEAAMIALYSAAIGMQLGLPFDTANGDDKIGDVRGHLQAKAGRGGKAFAVGRPAAVEA